MKVHTEKLSMYNKSETTLSYILVTIFLIVLMAAPIVLFCCAGFISVDTLNVADVSQGSPLTEDFDGDQPMFNIAAINGGLLYTNAIGMISGFIPWLLFALIILSPLEELILYFRDWKKGDQRELSVTVSPMLSVVIPASSLIMAYMVRIAGTSALYVQDIGSDLFAEYLTKLAGFTDITTWAVVAYIVLFVIPIAHSFYHKVIKKPKQADEIPYKY